MSRRVMDFPETSGLSMTVDVRSATPSATVGLEQAYRILGDATKRRASLRAEVVGRFEVAIAELRAMLAMINEKLLPGDGLNIAYPELENERVGFAAIVNGRYRFKLWWSEEMGFQFTCKPKLGGVDVLAVSEHGRSTVFVCKRLASSQTDLIPLHMLFAEFLTLLYPLEQQRANAAATALKALDATDNCVTGLRTPLVVSGMA